MLPLLLVWRSALAGNTYDPDIYFLETCPGYKEYVYEDVERGDGSGSYTCIGGNEHMLQTFCF